MADENAEQSEESKPAEDAVAVEEPQAEVAPAKESPAEESPADVAPTEEAPAAELTAADDLTLGEGESAEAPEELVMPAVIRGKIDQSGVAIGTGRRKTAVARVRIREGDGKLTINGRELEEYFSTDRDRQDIIAPLKATGNIGKVDVWVRANGGGTTGQAGAIVLGIARALQAKDPTLHHTLSVGGFLTRDSRMVERKKFGLRKARRSYQFSKR